jgi:hypothetical protein
VAALRYLYYFQLIHMNSNFLNSPSICCCSVASTLLHANLKKRPVTPSLFHPRPISIPSPLHAGNQIGDAGAAAVANALEPRRNGDGSWTPSTALTLLILSGEWVQMLMVVTEEE